MPVKVILMVLENRLYYNQRPILDYKIQYPQFFSYSHQRNLTKINNYYSSKALKVQRECTDDFFRTAIESYYNSIESKVPFRIFKIFYIPSITYNENCAISLYYDNYISLGGNRGIIVRTSDTWNIQDGEMIRLCQLFEHDVEEVNLIRKFIENEISKDLIFMDPVYYESYKNNITENFRLRNFFLLPEGIVIYFQQYDIAPFQSSIAEFLIPYEEGVTTKPECI